MKVSHIVAQAAIVGSAAVAFFAGSGIVTAAGLAVGASDTGELLALFIGDSTMRPLSSFAITRDQ